MKASHYNYLVKDADFGCALWNTKSGAFIRISQDEYDCLGSGRTDLLKAPQRFVSVGAIVADDAAEVEDTVNALNASCKNAPPYFRILTSTACNASCSYCYEKGAAAYSMTADCAQKTAEFIIDRYCRRQATLRLEWFGGEPLMNVPAISLICNRLTAAGVPFRSKIITNGLALNPDLTAAAAHEWHTDSVQLTIDAVGEEYELLKGVPNGSFRRLISSIGTLLQSGIRVRIRINDIGSGEMPNEVIEYMHDSFGNAPRLKLYVSPLYRREKMPSRQSMERILGFEKELFRLGYEDEQRYYAFASRHVRCFACSSYGYTVAPDGKIFNCSHLLTDDQAVGTVFDFNERSPKRLSYTEAPLSKECRACIFLPLCGGGCRSGELGVADIFQCFPYRSVIPETVKLRLKGLSE